jgi:hypothetical protein
LLIYQRVHVQNYSLKTTVKPTIPKWASHLQPKPHSRPQRRGRRNPKTWSESTSRCPAVPGNAYVG